MTDQTARVDVKITERIASAINESAYAPHEESWAKDRWPEFMPAAKRVLLAMREPTPAMLYDLHPVEKFAMAQMWRDMIDTALGEYVKATPMQHQTATIGQPLTWEAVLPLVRALRDIAQCSSDREASDVAAAALHETFPGADGLNVLFGRIRL